MTKEQYLEAVTTYGITHAVIYEYYKENNKQRDLDLGMGEFIDYFNAYRLRYGGGWPAMQDAIKSKCWEYFDNKFKVIKVWSKDNVLLAMY